MTEICLILMDVHLPAYLKQGFLAKIICWDSRNVPNVETGKSFMEKYAMTGLMMELGVL